MPIYNYYINLDSISHRRDDNADLRRCHDAQTNTMIVYRVAEDEGFSKKYEQEFLSLKAVFLMTLSPCVGGLCNLLHRWQQQITT